MLPKQSVDSSMLKSSPFALHSAYLRVGFRLFSAPFGLRLIDRQHAIAALPYCDLLITDDGDLIKRIVRVKTELRFDTASVLRGQAFIDTL
jgi:hypothetical protein